MRNACWMVVGVVLCGSLSCLGLASAEYSWQQPHAKVIETGDLQWQPEPFVFETGESVRYIDYENGDDGNDGKRKRTPWKHHPWDENATGRAAACKGIHTCVFKRGVVYRGTLVAADSGKPDDPIRLTSDPAWGEGEAAFYGSVRVEGGWKRCRAADAPDRLPEREKVWYADIGTDFVPRGLWELDGNGATRIHVAREPDWEIINPDDVMAGWPYWDEVIRDGGWKVDEDFLTNPDPDYYVGAAQWGEYGGNMGTLHKMAVVEEYDPDRHAVRPAGGNRGNRYYLENLPQFLDEPGEYYYAETGPHAGRLYLRLPEDRNPNHAVLEAARRHFLIRVRHHDHIRITGLRFSFLNTPDKVGWPTVVNGATAIRIVGDCRDIEVGNCRFLHLPNAVMGFARHNAELESELIQVPPGEPSMPDVMEEIVIRDNEIAHMEQGAIRFADGQCQMGLFGPPTMGDLKSLSVLRNRLHRIGFRPALASWTPLAAIHVVNGLLVEIAGNDLDRCWGSGIYVFGGKKYSDLRDRPLIRILIHHNRVNTSLLVSNDWGGIETWQGGPIYIYNNISANPVGPKHSTYLRDPDSNYTANAHAYYLDGAYKQYLFNNIAWGKQGERAYFPRNHSAFMQVLGYMNHWFNNTAYNFLRGTMHGCPTRSIYLGNVFAEMHGGFLNQHGYGEVPTLAYGNNIFYGKPETFGRIEGASGDTLEEFRREFAKHKPRLSQTGWMAEEMPLVDPAHHDFRLRPNSAADGRGAKAFVPWALYGVVGEWHFYRYPADPSVVVGENFYMTDEYVHRKMYYDIPRNDLTAHGVQADHYTAGPLEDWTDGALRFDGKSTYCTLTNERVRSDFQYTFDRPGGVLDARPGTYTYPGWKRKTVDMDQNSFLIEVHFRTEPGHTGGTLVSKMARAGYVLDIDGEGRARLRLRHAGKDVASRATTAPVNDGQWHHLVAEVDRAIHAAHLRLYLDGEGAAGELSGEMLSKNASLSNDADFLVGRGPEGDYFAGAIDFLRVSRGSLADAQTTIEELYEWQFNGPFLRDFCGNEPVGRRDAGALERTR